MPLFIFTPEESVRTIDVSVNLRALPATTMEWVDPNDETFHGYDLLSVADNRVSITEFIHDSTPTGNSVSAFGDFDTIQSI